MANVIQKLFVKLGVDSKELKSGFNKAEQETRGFSKAITKIGGLVAGAFSVAKLVEFGKEAHRLAGEMQGVQEAFERLDQPGLLDDLREGTRGTVSDLELMKAAVRADNFKVPLEKLGTFFEFATKRAAQTGESVDYLVNSIINGIGRKSTLVLDNLGISASELQEEMKKVGDFGKAAGNIIQRELGKAGDVTLTSTQRTEQLKAAWQNFLTYLGKDGLPIIDKFKTGLTNLLTLATTNINRETGRMADELEKSFANSLSGMEKEAAKSKIRDEIQKQNEALENLRKEYDKQLGSYRRVFGREVTLSAAKQQQTKETYSQILATKDYLTTLRYYYDSEKKLNDLISSEGKEGTEQSIGLIAAKKAEIEELSQKLNEATSKEQIIGFNVDLAKAKQELEDLENLFPKRPGTGMVKIEPIDIDAVTSTMGEYEMHLDLTNEKVQKVKRSTEELEQATLMLGDAFLSSFAQAEGGIEHLSDNLLGAVGREIKALIAKGIAGAVANTLATTPLPFFITAPLAVAAGAAAGTLMDSLIPSFASEGLVRSPTLAMMGDYPGAATNPEYGIKESTLKKLAGNGGGGKVNVTGRLRGSDIYIATTRAADELSNRGYNTRF